ncbi:MAG: glycosyltransferase family 9 protein [Alphaproteobacteria bacterium]|nr:glycosyltransferase family 9 protein [Alphaproteobacteria bacterium]
MLTSAFKKQPLRGGVLVIQPMPGIGDGLWHLRAYKALARFSMDQKITLLTRKKAQAHELLATEPWLHDVLWLDEEHHFGKLGGVVLGRDLKTFGFSTAWILHHSARYYIGASFAGIKSRYGYGFGWLQDMLTTQHALPRQDRRLHPIDRFEALFKKHGLPLLDEDASLKADTSLVEDCKKAFSHLPKPWIALGFGATQPARIWPTERFAAVGKALISQYGQGSLFLCGAPHEKDQGEALLHHVQDQGGGAELITDYPLARTAALLSLCDLFIGNDSGLLNVAASLSVPSLGLFPGQGVHRPSADLFKNGGQSTYIKTPTLIQDITVEDVVSRAQDVRPAS